MKLEAQRIAIAEACGWRFGPDDDCPEEHWHSPDGKPAHGFLLPDYLNDLNAMHEAEKVLIADRQKEVYADKLSDIAFDNPTENGDNGSYIGWIEQPGQDCFRVYHATAAQRAEAFLRSLSLWK